MIIHCPNCQQRYDLSEEYAGQNAECLDCGYEFIIPDPDAQVEATEAESDEVGLQDAASRKDVKKSGLRIGKKAKKSDLLLTIISFICCIAACAGIYHSTEAEFFLPAMILLIISLLLSLSDIYKKRLVPGLLVLLVSLIVPVYVFPGRVRSGFGKISDMAKSLAKDDGSSGYPEKDKSFWNKSLFEDPDAPSSSQRKQKPVKKSDMISGAFGKKLGEVYEPLPADKPKQIITGETLYQFNPGKPFRKFRKYYLLITPTSKKIYAIWAETGLMPAPEAEKEFKVMTAILENKYKRKSSSGVIPSLDRRELKISGRAVYLMSSFTGEVKLRYVDDELETLAEKEAVLNEAGKVDASSL